MIEAKKGESLSMFKSLKILPCLLTSQLAFGVTKGKPLPEHLRDV